jgi:hypothetical protein
MIFSAAYDALVAQITEVFPNHAELINPYKPEENDDLTMQGAWGTCTMDGIPRKGEAGCTISLQRDIQLVLCRRIDVGDLDRNSAAAAARRQAEKSLIEDFETLLIALENNVSLQNTGDPEAKITSFVYEQDAGLEFIRPDSNNFIMLRGIFSMSYDRSLTT